MANKSVFSDADQLLILVLSKKLCRESPEAKAEAKRWKESDKSNSAESLAERRRKLKQKYGLTPEEYNRMFENQSGCCAICKKHQSEFKRRLAVDHDHGTGQVRGLLCGACNVLLGSMEKIEQTGFGAKAKAYLISP